MKADFFAVLHKLLECLSSTGKLVINNQLIAVSNNKIVTPVGDIYPSLSKHKSRLSDQFVQFPTIQKFIDNLVKDNALVRINHIGFCYKVGSEESEKERINNLVQKSKVHLYVEPSSYEGIWLFVGNTEKWQDMMIELIPVERTNDKWKDYWLPHVQIDIDTTLTEEEIITYVKSAFGDSVKSYSIAINGVVYIVRNRLGTINGINIALDLATNSRNVKYHRQILLKKIDD